MSNSIEIKDYEPTGRYSWSRVDQKSVLEYLRGNRILKIWWSEDQLDLMTERGGISFAVEGDCCSHSYFHDFYGVADLLNKELTGFEEVHLQPGDVGYRSDTWEKGTGEVEYDNIQVYGYRFTWEDPLFGTRSAVLSFRNSSNGYYGGWMEPVQYRPGGPNSRVLTKDVVGDA